MVDDRSPRCLTGLQLIGLSGCSLEWIAGRVCGEPVFVYQRLAAEVRRRQGEPFERDPAVLAVRVECFPLRQVLYWKLKEVDDGATASTAGPSNATPHIRGGHSTLIRLLIRPPAITAQPPTQVFDLPDVDPVSVIEGHLDQVDTRLSRSGREAGKRCPTTQQGQACARLAG